MRAQIVLQGDLNKTDYRRATERLNEFKEELGIFLEGECGVPEVSIDGQGRTDEYVTPRMEIASAEIFAR